MMTSSPCFQFTGVDAEADDLDVALVELGLQLGHIAELGGADRGEVLRVRKQNAPAGSEPVVEADSAFGCLRFEIWRGAANLNGHDISQV